MGKETKAHRHNSIRQKAKRREKIRKLREKFLTADLKTREAILQKLRKISAAPPSGDKP